MSEVFKLLFMKEKNENKSNKIAQICDKVIDKFSYLVKVLVLHLLMK